MKKINVINEAQAFAPINIALIKYWGKRDQELNLPITNSLSVTLWGKGAYTRISIINNKKDKIIINNKATTNINLKKFLNLFRGPDKHHYHLTIDINIPIAAGLASSACIYASLVKALNNLYRWQLSNQELAILARLGSGSACRSIDKGFVEWHKDGFVKPLPYIWPELRIGLHIINDKTKPISSREAMQKTVETSPLYQSWPIKVAKDLIAIKKAIQHKDFTLFGKTAEQNALAMHAAMEHAKPPIIYTQARTKAAIKKIQQIRKSGLQIYFTQDAGPNLKLLFLAKDTEKVRKHFPNIEVVAPFSDPKKEQVILVDKNDKAIGVTEKIAAHKNAQLHRAFSIFILRKTKNTTEILLQQRQKHKYHCGGLWSNTCCSHPRPDEDIISAAQRRLQEEMGFTTDLQIIGKFHYKIKFANNLTENELDYILIGHSQNPPISINKKEVQDYKWMDLKALQKDLQTKKYTPWVSDILIYGFADLNLHIRY
jgi:diphosphomevalonate decarboxylase